MQVSFRWWLLLLVVSLGVNSVCAQPASDEQMKQALELLRNAKLQRATNAPPPAPVQSADDAKARRQAEKKAAAEAKAREEAARKAQAAAQREALKKAEAEAKAKKEAEKKAAAAAKAKASEEARQKSLENARQVAEAKRLGRAGSKSEEGG